MTKKLNSTELLLLENSDMIKKSKNADVFDNYRLQRDLHVGAQIGLGSQDVPIEVIELINDIEFIKSLNLIAPAYIDNIIMYIYLLASPLPASEYFINMIDKYIKPEGRSRSGSAFKKLMAGYLVYRITNSGLKNKASINATKKALVKSLKIDDRSTERAYSGIKKAFNKMKKAKPELKEKTLFLFDLLIFFYLYETESENDFIEMKKYIGKHHHTQKQHQKLIDAYQELCNTISYPLIKDAKKFLKLDLEHFKEEFTPEFIEKVLKFRKSKKQINFYTNEVTALLFITASNSFMPNILKNKSLMDKVFT